MTIRLCGGPARPTFLGVTLNFVRYGIPLLLFVAGTIVAATSGRIGITVGAMFVSAATATLLLNLLYRMGVEGDKARDREEAARRFYDEHGHWPDQQSPRARSQPPRRL
jgi:hypothetical protein